MSKNEMVSVSRAAAEVLLMGKGGVAYAEAAHEVRQALSQPAEQHQGEPVALPKRLPVRMPEGRNLPRGYAQACNDCIAEVEKLGPLYAHADSGEVERLRAVAEHFTGVSIKATEEVSTLRAKLAEREALLRAALQDCMDIEIMRSMRGSIYINRLSDRIKQALGNGEENDK